jgi:hypothetical protein
MMIGVGHHEKKKIVVGIWLVIEYKVIGGQLQKLLVVRCD